MTTGIFKVQSESILKEFVFKYTHEIHEFQDMYLLTKKGGHFESGTFSIGPDKEVKLKVIWGNLTDNGEGSVPRFRESHEETTTSMTDSGTDLSPPLCYTVSIVAMVSKPNLWLTQGTVSVRKVDGTVIPINKFPTNKQLRYKNIGCVSSDINDFITDSKNHKNYLRKGKLTVIIDGEVAMFKNTEIEIPPPKSNFRCLETVPHIEKLYMTQKFSDVQIVCEGTRFPAHKAILWARSTWFAKVFEKEENMSTGGIVINDVSADIFRKILYFMYTEKCQDLDEMALILLHFSHKFGVSDLKELCEKAMIRNVCEENVCESFLVGDRLNAEKLLNYCIKFMQENSSGVMATPAWNALTKQFPELVWKVLAARFKDQDV